MDAQKFPQVDEHQSSTASHEMGIVENAPTGMRRDLSRRHINMIGLAGMIVSSNILLLECFNCIYLRCMLCKGYRSIPCCWQCIGNCRTRGCFDRIHFHELFDSFGSLEHWRTYFLYACNWRFCETCWQIHPAGHRCRCWLELL